MDEKIINDALYFTKEFDFQGINELSKSKMEKAYYYLHLLSNINNNSYLVNVIIKKLWLIINLDNMTKKSSDEPEAAIKLFSLNVSDYIIDLVQKKRITDPLEIARFVYIELSKVLYYNITYAKTSDITEKQKICKAMIDPQKEKIFSYVVCSQWLQLYTYILKNFDINVIKKQIDGCDHVWGTIELNEKETIIVDATDYIDSSIDLSNAKGGCPTVGFVIVPKELENIRLFDIFNDAREFEIANKVKNCYEKNREIDYRLGYVNENGYQIENIISKNLIFSSDYRCDSQSQLYDGLSDTLSFFRNLPVPNNMDGYEIFAYYRKFIQKLPNKIKGLITQNTIYVDAISYAQDQIKQNFNMPHEYIEYSNDLLYKNYYKYLHGINEGRNEIFERIKKNIFNSKEINEIITKCEMKIAEYNRVLNSYYAINEIKFFEPGSSDTMGIQLYEPIIGKKNFNDIDELNDFKKTLVLK